jgi:hypothetical protein
MNIGPKIASKKFAIPFRWRAAFYRAAGAGKFPAGSAKNDEAPAFVPQSRDYGTAGE